MELQRLAKNVIIVPPPAWPYPSPGPDNCLDDQLALSSSRIQSKIQKHYVWDSVPSYRLYQWTVEDFLASLFGNLDFSVTFSNDNWRFKVPRTLTTGEKEALLKKRHFWRKSHTPGPLPYSRQSSSRVVQAHPTQTRLRKKRRVLTPDESPPRSQGPDTPGPSMQPLSESRQAQRCRKCKIILYLWMLVAAGSLAIGLWRSFAIGDEGKGFTDAAYVVAAGSIIVFPIQRMHNQRCRLIRVEAE